MGARSYLPTLGRFLQTDPIPGGSANPYDYANQDPANQMDLDGRCAFDRDLQPSIVYRGKYAYWEMCKASKRVGYVRMKLSLVNSPRKRQSLLGRVVRGTLGGVAIVGGGAIGLACAGGVIATDGAAIVEVAHCGAASGSLLVGGGILLGTAVDGG
jgi:hypothetical protein